MMQLEVKKHTINTNKHNLLIGTFKAAMVTLVMSVDFVDWSNHKQGKQKEIAIIMASALDIWIQIESLYNWIESLHNWIKGQHNL